MCICWLLKSRRSA